MKTTLRYRGNKNNIIELAKNLDAFKKVPEKYTETTEIGGTLSLLSRLFIVYLIYKEVRYYQDARLVFQFEPDIDMDDKVQMHVDVTVAMPCRSLSGSVLMDETQQDVFAYGTLRTEDTWWEMSPEEREVFENMQKTNSFLREEYHSVADILFKDIIKSDVVHQTPISPANKIPIDQYDACRLHGTISINKVAGVLHLVGGAEPIFGLFEDHWMIEFKRTPANFSHRINRFSFGQYSHRIVQPLEGDERIVMDEETTVQYFLKIVPTVIHNTFSTINTFQYSVTENIRKLDSSRNSYGSPGIYFKYDWSALKIVVRMDRDNLIQFIIRLCSIISGIIVTSGILNALLINTQRRLINFLAPQLLHKPLLDESTIIANKAENTKPTSSVTLGVANESITVPTWPNKSVIRKTNDLLSMANEMSRDSLNNSNNDMSRALLIPAANRDPVIIL